MLRFTLFRFPITVRPGHFVVAALLGWPRTAPDADSLVVWAVFIVTVFVSVLWHEIGHAVAIAGYGGEPQIALYEMGGMTQDVSSLRVRPGQSIVISLAGPAFGFALGGLLWGLALALPTDLGEVGRAVLRNALFVNIGWGVLNLLPMLPLDGGHVVRSVFEKFTRGKGTRPAAVITVATAVVVVAGALYARMFFAAFLFGALGVQAFRLLRNHGEMLDDERLVEPLQDALERLGEGDVDEVANTVFRVMERAKSEPVKNAAVELMAWAALTRGKLDEARKIAAGRTDIEEGDDSLLDMGIDAYGDDPADAYARFSSLDRPVGELHPAARRAALFAALRSEPAGAATALFAEQAGPGDEALYTAAAERLLIDGFAYKALDLAEARLAAGVQDPALAEVAHKAAAFDHDADKAAHYASLAETWRAAAGADQPGRAAADEADA